MSRYPSIITATLAAGLAATALASGAPKSRAPKHPTRMTTFHATAVVDSATNVDNPPAGDTQGDTIVFTQKLYRTPARKTIIGTDQAYCVRTIPGKARVCTGIFYLKGGQITIIGPESEKRHALAITGGTGAWSGARGQVVLKPNGPIVDQMTFTISR
jgi:hypothetical protein